MNFISAAIDIVLLIGIAIALFILSHYSITRYHRVISQNPSKKQWRIFLLNAVGVPLKVLIVVIAVVMIGNIILLYYNPNSMLLRWFGTMQILASIVTLTWTALSFIVQLEKYFLKTNSYSTHEYKEAKRSTIILSMKLCFTVIATISVISILQTLGVSMQAIIAFVSLGGVTVGFASRDLIGSLFGTMMIYLTRPFTIGDRIKINNFDGFVENITWITTQLRADSKKLVFIPNIQFLINTVENASQITEKRIMLLVELFHSDINAVNICIAETIEMLGAIKSQQGDRRIYLNHEILAAKDYTMSVKFNLYFDQNITSEELLVKKQEIINITSNVINKHSIRFSAKLEE